MWSTQSSSAFILFDCLTGLLLLTAQFLNFLISRGFHLSSTSTSYSKVPFSSTEVYTLPLQPHSSFLFQPLSFHTSPGRLLACDTICYLIISFLPLHLRLHPAAPFGFISVPRSERYSQRCSSFKFLTPRSCAVLHPK